jgi:hypothetical protein
MFSGILALSLFALYIGVSSCGSQKAIQVEIISSEGNQYTCKWEEEFLMKPKNIYFQYIRADNQIGDDVEPPLVENCIPTWVISSKPDLHLIRSDKEHYPLYPLDIVRYEVCATFVTSGDPVAFVRDNIINNDDASYSDLEYHRDGSHIEADAYVTPLETKRASLEIIDDSQISRSGAGKATGIKGKAISHNDKLFTREGDTIPLSEVSGGPIYKTVSAEGDLAYFDFDPQSTNYPYMTNEGAAISANCTILSL